MTNSVAIVGNLVRDPETAGKEGTICKMRVAVNDRAKRDGEWVDAPGFYNVTCFGKLGENCVQYLEKGKQIAVSGRLHWHAWEQDGKNREAVEIVANQVQFLGSPRDSVQPGEGEGEHPSAPNSPSPESSDEPPGFG